MWCTVIIKILEDWSLGVAMGWTAPPPPFISGSQARSYFCDMETSWVSHRSARPKVFRRFGFGNFGQMSWLLFPCSQSISYAYFIISSRVLGREPICQSVISLRYAGACHYLALPSFIMTFCSFLFVCLSPLFFSFFFYISTSVHWITFLVFVKVSLTFFFAHLTRWPLATMQS